MKSAQQIQEFLDENAYRFDLGVQYLGDEPNAYRKPWEASSVRTLMVASWPYEQCVSGDTVVLAHGVGPVRIQNVVRDVFVDCAGKPQGTSAAIDNGQRDVVRVSAGGRSVVCTPDHRILVARPKAWRKHGPSRAELVADAPEEWVEAQDVQPGDVLKVYYGQNIWADERVRLNPPARVSARSSLVFPEELTPDLAYLLGLLATDASIRWQHGSGMSAAVRWTADDPGILAALLEMVPRVFGKTPVVVQREGRSAVVELASTRLVQWLRDSVGVVSRRRVPDTIFASPRDVVAAYLSGVFDGDGFFPVHTYMPGRPQFANTERELVEAVSVLLLNMGCPVSGRSEEVRASALLPQGARYRPIHRLAATWAEDMDWSWMQLHHSTRGVGLEAWKQYRPRQLRKCKARGGVSFVEVESVEPAGSETVWDLTVPSTESFTANGIVVHNSAGNGSIPAVYKTINIARDDFMCDRFYLPATPRDMRLLAKNDIPVFGIESKHPLMDFDVVGTSISYPVLTMSFVKMLSMSGIPVRWKDRDGSHPFVIFGGQAYAAPEVLAPVVDAVFLGEVEDEPGNPGLGAVLERIAQFKEQGRWVTDRVGCYADLAREFSFLYFPRFVELEYGYQDRGLEHPSKQVVGYRSLLDGMKMPFQRHYVKDLDSIPPLDDPPLLYVDAQNASGDAEVSRGSIASSGSVLIEGQGIRRFSSWQGDDLHPHDADLGEMRADVAGALWPVSHVITSGHREVVRVSTVQGHEVICTPDHEISVVRGPLFDARRARRGEPIPEGAVQFYAKKNVGRLSVLESQDRVWARADGVAVDDVIPVYYGQNIWGQEQIALQSWAVHPLSALQRLPSVLDEDVAWLLGMLAGDCTVRYKANRPKFSHRLQIKTEDPGVAEKTVRVVERLFGYRVSSRSREGALPQALVWEIRSKDLMEWLAVNFGVIDNVTRRRVPEQIMRSPRDVVASFVAGFYDSDGTYDDRNGRLSWCSQSEELIRDLSLILLNFGAPCSVRVNEPPLGDRGVKLSWKVQALQAPDSEWSWLHPSHTRRLPQVRQWQEWGSKVAGNTARNGVMYCAVTGVTPAGSDDCYDISVPGPVSFTCNGMLVHNCPAWSIPVDAQVEIAGRGSVRFDSVQVGELIRVGSEFHRIRGVVVHGVRDTIRVVTRQGLDVRCTPEHEIYAVRGGASLRRAQRDTAPREWVHAEDLRPGDLMLRTCGGTVWPQHPVVIEHQAALHYVGRGRAERYYDTVWPDLLDDDVAWLLGMVTGDCAIRSNQVEFRIERRAPEIRTRLIEILKGRFDIDVTEVVSLSGKVDHIRANSARLVEWLALNFGLSPRKELRKVVPEQLFRSPRSVVGSYLSALYDSNGTMLIPRSPESATTIRFVVYSESQIRGIAELLRLLGLPCAIRSTVLNEKRDGSPSAKPSVRWEVRTAGSQDPEAYTWLQSLEPFKNRHIDHFRPPRNGGACVGGLQYVEVVGIEEDAPTRVMDVDVPGPQAFNVSGIQVHNCSFCRLSLVTKPYRQRSPEYMVEFGKSLKQNMGGVHLAYVAPDFPFHSQKKRMTKALMENVTDEVDGAAMRVDDFIADEQFVLLASFAGMDSVTLGLEGSSQRMRDLVGKGISDAEVRETVTKALEAGVRKIKLFMISNLPGEDWGDIKQVVRLAEDLAQIRDSMNKPHVVIQLSWTPLLIEANTPFQWFAPTPANYALADAWKELKDLRIDAKIGAKAQVDKVTFFQLCQRASREIGEAMVDVMLDLDVACWGGVPRRMREALDDSLRKWGFLNGLEDAFDERGKDDLFGWEFIDTGVSKELLWSVYQQMVEFLQYTDSATYDELVGQEYHGAEWVPRCDERCQGNACGACDREDLEIRQKMLASAEDESVELGDLTPIDERSVAMKIRARLDKPEQYRLVTNDHWRFNLRRALYRAREATGMSARIAKRTIVFASDAIGYKDWTHGTDYVEFGLTKVESTERVTEFLARVNEELVNPATGQPWMQVQEWVVHPPTSPSIRSDIDLTLYEVEVEETPERVQARLQAWDAAESVDMMIRAPVTYFGPPTEVVNAKEYVEGVWLVRDGHRVTVRMLVRGRPTPYNVFAALMGQKSWLEVAKYPARRVDSFVTWDGDQWDFFRPACEQCGASIPVNVLEEPFDAAKCPMCLDRQITV